MTSFDASGPLPHETQFRVGETGVGAPRPDAPNIAGRSSAEAPLVLFLAGTGNQPASYRAFLDVAAREGYHVLGLDYSNRGLSVAQTCAGDSDCYGLLQGNRFDGRTPSHYSHVGETNGVRNRLLRALDHLATVDPAGGWGRFTTGGDIDWGRVVVAGHSQGGGEAAFIAHEHRVLGQLTFGAPILTDGENPASWLISPGATPPSAMYAFASRDDKYFARITDSWRRLGLPGPIEEADIPVPAGRDAHRLVSTFDFGDPGIAHGRVVNHLTPRTADGPAVFEPVWQWMLQQVGGTRQPPQGPQSSATPLRDAIAPEAISQVSPSSIASSDENRGE